MRAYISDLIREIEYEELEPMLTEANGTLCIAKERTKRQVFQKIRQSYRKMQWIGIIQVGCLLLLLGMSIPVTARVVIRYLHHGALVSDENRHLVGSEMKTEGYLQFIKDKDGIWHDQYGKVYTEEEWQEYHKVRWPENKYFDSVEGDDYVPRTVVGMPAKQTDGGVSITPEVILLNADAGVMADENDRAWELEPGDTVTISYEKYPSEVLDSQYMKIGIIKDRVLLYETGGSEEIKGTETFEIKEAGSYYFYFINGSSDYLTLKEGTVEIR